MYSVFEFFMPEKDSTTLAAISLELGIYPDALVECLIRYAAEHPEDVKAWYREKQPAPYYVFQSRNAT